MNPNGKKLSVEKLAMKIQRVRVSTGIKAGGGTQRLVAPIATPAASRALPGVMHDAVGTSIA